MPNFTERDGVRISPDGHEVCQTQAAWDRRRGERLKIAGYRCECKRDCPAHRFRRCNAPLVLHAKDAIGAGQVAHVHHKTKRGMGGGTRDDRVENLEANCPYCHLQEEERQRFGKVKRR